MIVAVVFLFSAVVSLIRPGPVSSPRAFAKQSSLRSNLLIWNDLCLTNCYFAEIPLFSTQGPSRSLGEELEEFVDGAEMAEDAEEIGRAHV